MSSIAVPAEAAGERLDRFLANLERFGTRARVQRVIAAGGVRVNGKVAKAGLTLRPGDGVDVDPAAPRAGPAHRTPQAEDIALVVLFEDDDLLVIDKPAGLVVHPAPGHWSGTLVSALLHHWRGPRPGLDELRPGIVHRLDRDTSGVLAIGKTPEVVTGLAAQFRARTVAKEYAALVWRCPRLRRGVIDQPIGRHPKQRKRMTVRASGRAAVTRYEVVEELAGIALLRVSPETGRTHQIRVHLAAAGHPIVADTTYGRARHTGDAVIDGFPRQALHAARLEIDHPMRGDRLVFEAPLPSDMDALVAHLRSRRARARGRGFA